MNRRVSPGWPFRLRLRTPEEPFGAWVARYADAAEIPSPARRAETYRAIREAGGVARGPGGSALVAGYDVLRAVLLDPATYTRRWAAEVNPDLGGVEGKENVPLRRSLSLAFSHAALSGHDEGFRSVAREVLAAMTEAGERDLDAGLARPYAFRLGADLFDLGAVPIQEVVSWAPHLGAFSRRGAAGDHLAGRSFRSAMREAYGRAQRGEGTAGLAAMAAMPRAMASFESFERSLASMFVSGAAAIHSALYEVLRALVDHPGAAARVGSDRSLGPAFVEETLRLAPPAFLIREAARDVELGGLVLAEGTRIYGLLEPANRDPAVFEDPDAFRLGRPHRHLSFGLGVHYCVGDRLTRMELVAALDVVLDVWPSLRDAVTRRTRRAGPVYGRSAGPLRLRRPPPAI